MKKTLTALTTLIITLLSTLCYSQDIIELNNGEEIESKVTEVLSKEIKYKKFNNLDGPTYTINIGKVIMIRYENGEKELFSKTSNNFEKLDISSGFYKGSNKLTKKEFKEILSTNQKAYDEYKSGNLVKTLGLIIALPSSAYLGWSIGQGNVESEMLIAGGLGLAGGFLAVIGGNSMIKKSIKTYNNSHQNVSYEFRPNSNGISLALKF